jgi:D-psicose/D-tagatose/L-ribulose 3-epimerase
MKYGAHSYLFTPKWTDDEVATLERVRGLGLDFFEIAVGDDVFFDFQATGREANSLGLELVISPGGQWPLNCDLSADDKGDRETGLRWHCHWIDRAVELGATAYCGALYGHPGVVKRRPPPEGEIPRTCEGLHRLARYGGERGVRIVVEPMSHFRTHLANTPEQIMRIVSEADHPNLRVCLDTYHLLTEILDYREGIMTARKALWGMHMCENNRGVPGPGLIPWETVFGALGEIGFNGYLLFEAYNSSTGNFAFERGMFHNVCADPETFVREGLAFIKDGLSSPDI